MFLAFQHGVMYVLSFATMVTVVATALAVAVLLVMMVGRSVWRLFRPLAASHRPCRLDD